MSVSRFLPVRALAKASRLSRDVLYTTIIGKLFVPTGVAAFWTMPNLCTLLLFVFLQPITLLSRIVIPTTSNSLLEWNYEFVSLKDDARIENTLCSYKL